jgi:hypothetical protein
MEWTFELSLLVFLALAALSQTVMMKSRGLLSLPLVFGLLFMAGYGFNILPRDFIARTRLLDIGVIAYHVLIIHAGTLFNRKILARNKKALLIVLAGFCVVSGVLLTLGSALFGRPLAFMAAAALPGGGATCAIASFTAMKNHPELSFFPWLLFMFQGIFGIPLFGFFISKTMVRGEIPPGPGKEKNTRETPHRNQPGGLKGTAYYLGILMFFSVINKLVFSEILGPTGIALTLPALLMGIILGETGLVERGPLHRADCFGLLMLGLMSLMAETLAHVPFSAILAMAVPVLLFFILATGLLILTGMILSRPLGVPVFRAMAIAMSMLTASPANAVIINAVYGSRGGSGTAEPGGLIEETDLGSIYVINIFSVALISILAAFL